MVEVTRDAEVARIAAALRTLGDPEDWGDADPGTSGYAAALYDAGLRSTSRSEAAPTYPSGPKVGHRFLNTATGQESVYTEGGWVAAGEAAPTP